jgi:hypothetical protein
MYINKRSKIKLKKVSFEDIVKIIPNNNNIKVIQYIESPKIKISESYDDFDFFVYFED